MGVTHAQQQSNDSIKKIKIDDKVILPFGKLSKDRVVGAVEVITAEDISHTSDYNVESTLAGQVASLVISKGNASPGIDNTFLKIRGNSRGGASDFPLIIIDGIANRSLSSIAVDEVESITVLKDITAKMLYGSKAANGVLLVTTKRGYDGQKKFTVFTETGIKTPSVLPEYLSSAQYARLYNQARINDGLDPIYSNETIANYANNPSELFPNVDFYDELLKTNADFFRFNAQLQGGDETTKYFVNLGFVDESGLEKFKTQSFNRVNVRGNLDYKVNNTLSMFLDIAGRIDFWERANIGNGGLFTGLSTHRPNDYTLLLDNGVDLGSSDRVGNNLLGDLTRAGYVRTNNYYAQTNLGANLDLSSITPGLTATGYITFDFFNNLILGQPRQYSRVNPADGIRVGQDTFESTERALGDNVNRNLGLVGTINYDRTWEDHALQVDFSVLQQTLQVKSLVIGRSTLQDDKNMNVGLRTNYAYKNKYVVEGAFSYMGSDKFLKENRWKLYGSGGLGWIISNEDFLKDSKAINFLKLKGSFGVMGYDANGSFGYLLDQDFYLGAGALRTGPLNSSVDFGWRASQIGNPNLTFEESQELNVGLEASLFNNKVDLEINYFDELRSGIPITLNNALPDYLGTVKPIGNFNEISNKGVDLFLNYKDNIGELKFSIGANAQYSKAVHEVFDELNAFPNLNRTGLPTDAIRGFVDLGLYQNQDQIDADGLRSVLGEVIPGDIRYQDIVEDGVIDFNDIQEIGNSSPRINYSLNLQLEYKNFGLFVIGQGASDFDRITSNSYYWNRGENKWSVQALNAANPGNVAGATAPRLTSLPNGHSYRGSTYWMVDGDYFKIRTAELSYTLPIKASQKIGSDKTKIFVRGNDILRISKIKDSDPENLNAGITNYPMYTTLSMGVNIRF